MRRSSWAARRKPGDCRPRCSFTRQSSCSCGHLLAWSARGWPWKAHCGWERSPRTLDRRSRVQPQRIAHIVQTNAMGQLGIEQAHHVTQGFEGSRLILSPGLPGDFGHLVRRNKVQIWRKMLSLDRVGLIVFFFIPALWQGLSNTFLKICGTAVKSVVNSRSPLTTQFPFA